MPKSIHKLSTFIILSFLWSCAQIVAPTGGKKDSTPPELVEVTPANETKRFTKSKITFAFNENIQVTKVEEQVIISPPVNRKPDITAQGKELTVRFYEALQPNTTYTINFGNAVGDNTENNVLSNLTYVFSTGDEIDSNQLKGNILNSFTNKPEKGVTVGLYPTDGFKDSTIIKQKPVYLSKTGSAGDFVLSHLPKQSYRLVAFTDVNQNLRYDRQENIAFEQEVVASTDTNYYGKLLLFKPDLYPIGKLIDTFCSEPNKFTLIVYKPEKVSIQAPNKTVYTKYVKGIDQIDTFHVFITNPDAISKIHASINGVNHELNLTHQPKFKAQKVSFTYTKQPELGDTITIRFNNPITRIEQGKIQLLKDSLPAKFTLLQQDAFTFKVICNWEEKTNYTFSIPDSSFMDVYGQWNKKDGNKFVTKSLKDYANLILHVKKAEQRNEPYVLQLLTTDEKTVLYEYIIHSSTDISIANMLPGTYVIKYIIDTNRNGLWDNGDFNKRQQPEKVGYYPQPITVRAYWDLEQSVLLE